MRRKIVRIDEDKCDGCGLCVPACAEGAIQVIDGKARLVSEVYCDGLGACLGECPQGAITIEERDAEAFNEEAVRRHLAGQRPTPPQAPASHVCPGSAVRAIQRQSTPRPAPDTAQTGAAAESTLTNWPVQLHLMPPSAPYLQGAKLLIAADCVPFAFADFHRRLLDDRVLVIACPKLDDVEAYFDKLVAMFRDNDIESIDVAHMEVPCCFGLVRLVSAAVAESGKALPVKLIKVGIRGDILEEQAIDPSRSAV